MKFKSKLEEWAWKQFKKWKIPVEYESCSLKYVVPKSYIPDFTFTQYGNRSRIYIETKGYFRPEDRTKALSVRKSNPGIDLRFIFSQDNKLSKKAKMRYSDWCKKHGFLYAVGEIPKEWFECT